ncbi:MAG: formylglycine-generating enzyme family protein, partial [Candidatus Electrothrix sp. GM3_4]|nr:formylglycine-generating enzyme family protein [Candidatus Electrothrix sp. GM3_4]
VGVFGFGWMIKPDWASIAQGRQPGGKEYFHLLTQGEEQKELAWCDPGEYPVRNLEEQVAVFSIEKGFFAVLDETEEIQMQGFQQPHWAENMGVDQYGLYADLVFKGVTQRFRWIQPGSFLMGSHEEKKLEPEQWNQEGARREVILTESYWMADTACSIDLWKKVMGGDFDKYEEDVVMVVKQVSWEDVQVFLTMLNKKINYTKVILPSEAQWEYACRAGGTIPFHTDMTPDNKWGIGQIHGYVDEWCQDLHNLYPDELAIDPNGPSEGSTRVVRGGCLNNSGRISYFFHRSGHESEYRNAEIGFRLACRRTSRT